MTWSSQTKFTGPAQPVSRPALLAPSVHPSRITHHASRAFTLIELILALGIFALVLVAINTAFFAAVRLRQKTSEVLDESLPLSHSLAVLRRDLQNAVPPGGVLAGNFRSDGPAGTTGPSAGSTTATTGNKGAGSIVTGGQNGGLDFFTTTGTLADSAPWGDIQEVNYQLMDPTNRASAYGKDLVRSVTRNLLASSTQMAQPQRLASNVQNLDFFYYDGMQWRDSWDTTAGDAGLPAAVRVRVKLASSTGVAPVNVHPIEMVVLLDSQSVTNQ